MKQNVTNQNGKEPVLHQIILALRQIYQGDPLIVWLTMSKNVLEAAFDGFCAVYFIKYIYECIENHVYFQKLIVMVSIFCTFHIAVHLLSAYSNYMEKISAMKVYRHIFRQIIHRAKKIDISQYENPKFYDDFSRALDEALEQGMGCLFLTAWSLGCIVRASVAIGILITVDPALLLFVIPPLLGSLFFGLKESTEEFAARREETVAKRKMEYAKRVFYEKKYAAELRLYPMAQVLFGLYRQGYEERYQKNQLHQRRIAVYRILETVLFAGILSFGSYLYITYRVKTGGRTSVAAYVAMVSAVGYIVTCISDALGHFSQAGKLSMYMKSIRGFMECPVEEKVKDAIAPEGNLGEISFEHVSYHYAGSSQMIIEDLNLHVKQGEHIALVGEPLCENVLMKSPETEKERQIVIDSLEKAQFGEVLKKMPCGIDTFLTKEFDENGLVCSGGQAQKIAIARVFAKDPQVVILDEPSSALDPIAEYNMYCNMMAAAKGKTVFFISHRMSSARMADRILLLEHGHIIEQGTHEELMEKNGRYAEMFRLQAKNYQEISGGNLYAE